MPDDRSAFWTAIAPNAVPGLDEAGLRRNFDIHELPRDEIYVLSVMEILKRDLGYARSLAGQDAVLGNGEPIPLMSYGFVEYVAGLDLSACDVLEIGGGQSTLFWSKRAKSVRTFDNDPAWTGRLAELPNVEITIVDGDAFAAGLAALERPFDIIVIDCGANRFECARAAAPRLARGGFIVLDNSDWYPNTARYLRDQDLIQVDYPDFRPNHHYRCATSMFLHPEFRPKSLDARLPRPVIGGKDVAGLNGWDEPASG